MSDPDRISLYSTKTITSWQVLRIKKNINKGVLVDPKPNSLNLNHKNCMTNRKRVANEILGVKVLSHVPFLTLSKINKILEHDWLSQAQFERL